jgi:hypothetical protein
MLMCECKCSTYERFLRTLLGGGEWGVRSGCAVCEINEHAHCAQGIFGLHSPALDQRNGNGNVELR